MVPRLENPIQVLEDFSLEVTEARGSGSIFQVLHKRTIEPEAHSSEMCSQRHKNSHTEGN